MHPKSHWRFWYGFESASWSEVRNRGSGSASGSVTKCYGSGTLVVNTFIFIYFYILGRVHFLLVHIWICGTAHLHPYLLHPRHCAAQEWAKIHSFQISMKHRLNMEEDLQIYLGSMLRDVHTVLTGWDPVTPSLLPHWDSYYEGAIGQQR